MRIEIPREVERFGPIMFYDTQKVYELDSGLKNTKDERLDSAMTRISYESFQEIQKQMVIIVPVMEERIKLIEGVLYGIPHNCLIIVISNSPRDPAPRAFGSSTARRASDWAGRSGSRLSGGRSRSRRAILGFSAPGSPRPS